MPSRWALLAVGLLVAVAGCGGGEASKVVATVVPVSGKILQADGKPVANAWVVLTPKDPPGNEATAATQTDGTFRLGTFAKQDGVVPGHYVVTVQPHPNAPSAARPQIPSRYTSAKTSPVTIEITRDGPKELAPIYLK